MAIDLSTSPGGLFRRLGRIVYAINTWNTARGATLGTMIDNIEAQYASSLQYVIDGLYQTRDAARSAASGLPADLSRLAQTTLIEQANADTALSSKTVNQAMTLLISQMIGAGTLAAPTNDVDANTVSATPTAGSTNTGTATCAASCTGPDGRPREYVIAETVTLTASTDSQSGTATAGRETWALTTPVSQSDQLSWDWPKGSGAATSVTASDVSSANKLVNGDFEDFTTNDPDYWDILVGVAGADIDDEATNFYAGAKALKITGDGATLSSIRQKFNSSADGTSYKLKPSTVYAVSYWVKMSATPAAGVLGLSLIDSGGSIITNDFGTSQTVSKALTAVSTSWVNVTGFFQTPSLLNSTQYSIKLHLTTALTSPRVAYIDNLTMVEAKEMYKGGPYVAVFPGATATVKGDTFSIAIANNWAGDFQKAFQRIFDMRSLGMQLPSDTGGTETIDDAWIV